jgi:branched-chain amino acid transport system permease protein
MPGPRQAAPAASTMTADVELESSYEERRRVREPLPAEVIPARGPRGRAPRAAAPLVGFGLAALASAVLSGVWNATLSLAMIFGLMGLSVVILTGFVGQLSLMPATFVGIGAFSSAAFVSRLDTPFWWAVPLAALATVPAALLIGAIALRLKGLYLAIMTLVFADVVEQFLFKKAWFTGQGGVAEAPRPTLAGIDFASDKAYYILVLVATAIVLLLVHNLSRSRTARACYAVRDNEAAAQAWGINVAKYKLLAFALSGFVAGFAGALYGHWVESVSAVGLIPPFGLQFSLTIVFFTIAGGVRSIWGPMLGGFVWVVLVQRLLAESPNGQNIALSVFGVVVLLTMLYRPNGLMSLGPDLRRIARRLGGRS